MWRPLSILLSFSPLLSGAELFTAGIGLRNQEAHYYGEGAKNSTLLLTPSNGFFDKGFFKATDPTPAPDADKHWIPLHFETLQTTKPGGSARWHLWFDSPGKFDISLTGKGVWNFQIDDSHGEIDAKTPLQVVIHHKGKRSLILTPKSESPNSTITQLELKNLGPGTKLLRARWRPAAAHDRYESSTVKNPSIWVFETQNIGCGSNYSPMTTNFGYFGATFSDNGRASGGVNFSMWAAGQSAQSLPPLPAMPHLLATGNPAAEFSGFGHEGSGVKLRGWEPFAHHPKSVIQALRLEVSESFETYYGYIFDDQKDSWKLYTAGRRALKTGQHAELRATSFCEIPGPPAVERTGDLVRKVRRRGWFFGDDRKWHQADTSTLTSKKEIANRFSGIDPDGWFILGTGGMEFFDPPSPRRSKVSSTLPDYLAPEKEKQLFDLPVTFTGRSASAGKTNASVSCQLEALRQAEAWLFYGEVDCLTFARRDLHGTERNGISTELTASNRVWQFETPAISFSVKSVTAELKELKPETTYFYRFLVKHDGGKSWDFESGSFTTAK